MFETLELIPLFLSISFVYYASKKGISSPIFIVSLHLVLGCFFRYFYLLFEPEWKLTYFIPVDSGTYWELVFFVFTFFTSFLLIYKFRSASARVNYFFDLNLKSKRSINVVILLTITFITFYYLIMAIQFGGILSFFNATINRVSSNVQGLAYFSLLFDLAITGSLILLYFSGKVQSPSIKRTAYIVSSIVVITLILQGGRGNFIQYIISIMIIFDGLKNRVTIFNKNILLIAIAFVIMSTVGLAARKSSQQDIPIESALSSVNSDLMGALMSPFSLFDHYGLAKIYTDKYGNDYGLFYAEQLTRPVPRSLWDGKPQVLGKKIRLEFWGDDSGGVPAGIIGEAYISYSLMGVFFISVFLAYGVAALQSMYEYAINKGKFIIFVSIITPYLGFNLLRTGLDTAFTRIMIYFLAFVLFKYIIYNRFKLKG